MQKEIAQAKADHQKKGGSRPNYIMSIGFAKSKKRIVPHYIRKNKCVSYHLIFQ